MDLSAAKSQFNSSPPSRRGLVKRQHLVLPPLQPLYATLYLFVGPVCGGALVACLAECSRRFLTFVACWPPYMKDELSAVSEICRHTKHYTRDAKRESNVPVRSDRRTHIVEISAGPQDRFEFVEYRRQAGRKGVGPGIGPWSRYFLSACNMSSESTNYLDRRVANSPTNFLKIFGIAPVAIDSSPSRRPSNEARSFD